MIGLLAAIDDIRLPCLLIGGPSLVLGVMLLLGHHLKIQETIDGWGEIENPGVSFRKYRRRALGSSLFACQGVFLGSVYWVTERRVFAFLVIAAIFCLTMALAIGVWDMFAVGLQRIGQRDREEQRKKLEEIIRQHESRREEPQD